MKAERQSSKEHSVENWEVKPAHQGEGYEVMVKTSTLLKKSPKKLDVHR